MPLDLDPLEQRLVGVLLEKEATVPETYPLTVNALVAGSNQKSNRDPELRVQDYEVEGALKSLLVKGWVLEHEREGGRTRRYAHQADKQLALGKAELAVLAELLLRGPQTPTELATRCARMHAVGAPADVERRLRELAARPVPYVRELERRPREHAARWTHLLGPRADAAATPPGPPDAQPRADAPAHGRPPEPPRDPGEVERLRDLVETLEQRVLALEERLDRLDRP
jgi:uncharacterized protein YceH (UPF0502 family)